MRRHTKNTAQKVLFGTVASAGLVLVGGCWGAIHQSAVEDARTNHAATQRSVLQRYPERPGFSRSAADLAQFTAKWLRGYRRQGQLIHGRLSKFQPTQVSLRRGYCYLYVLRLKPGAQFSATARKGLSFTYRKLKSGVTVNSGPGVHGPGAVLSAGCPLASEPATFSGRVLLAQLSGRSADQLGRGGYSLQLYAKRVSRATLTHLAADRARQIRESREFKRRLAMKRARRQRRGCAVCQQKYTTCIADWRRGARRATCRRELQRCVFSAAGLASPSMCR